MACSSCHTAPFAESVYAQADAIAPRRARGTDGSCPSLAHHQQNPGSDHEPSGPLCRAHAVDVTTDPPVFDPRDYLDALIARHDNRIKYIVANFSGWHGRPNTLPDMICGPDTAWKWQQNGSFKRDHATAPHVHYSFWPSAENSTAPFFIGGDGPQPAQPPPPPAPPVTTDLGAAAVHITDLSMNLDGAGNGHIPVKGVKASQVIAVTGIATQSPEKVGHYTAIPTVNLTIGADGWAEVVVEHGPTNGPATVRVAHV